MAIYNLATLGQTSFNMKPLDPSAAAVVTNHPVPASLDVAANLDDPASLDVPASLDADISPVVPYRAHRPGLGSGGGRWRR